ncbi:MAG: hypothetical protein PVF91_00350 [Chromatiales bacterium]|jgi:hypothetical protein
MRSLVLAGTLMLAAGAVGAGDWRSPIWGPAFDGHPDLAVQYAGVPGGGGEASFVTSLERIQAGNPDGYPHAGYAPGIEEQPTGDGWITSLERIQAGNPDGYPHPSVTERASDVGGRVSGGEALHRSTL